MKYIAASIRTEASASLCTRTALMMLEGQNTTRAVASRSVAGREVQLLKINSAKTTKPKNSKSESHCSPSSYGIHPPVTMTFDQRAASA